MGALAIMVLKQARVSVESRPHTRADHLETQELADPISEAGRGGGAGGLCARQREDQFWPAEAIGLEPGNCARNAGAVDGAIDRQRLAHAAAAAGARAGARFLGG